MDRMEHIYIARCFGKFIFWRSFDEPKHRKKLCGSKLAFKQVITVYIVRNETEAVFLALYKGGGETFRGTWYLITSNLHYAVIYFFVNRFR